MGVKVADIGHGAGSRELELYCEAQMIGGVAMMRKLALASVLFVAAGTAAAQTPPAPPAAPPAPPALEVGTLAPDFALTGATRYGVLRDQVRLSDYRGKTVVLAFFFKARTRG
jgi:cytochrome oxidase Cu insertion factor (SCO1/SenC/PrrC family)